MSFALSGLDLRGDHLTWAMPQAIASRPFGANFSNSFSGIKNRSSYSRLLTFFDLFQPEAARDGIRLIANARELIAKASEAQCIDSPIVCL